MTKLIVGCGYLGRRVARAWISDGHVVFALTRSESKAKELRAEGIQPIVGDLAVKGTLCELPPVDTILYAVGFDRSINQSMRQVYVDGLANVLDVVDSSSVSRFFFVSSTGVYGQDAGEWVDEQSVCQPRREGGRVCLEAENVLRAHPLGKSAIILRLAGLYGPGRIPRRRELTEGLSITVPTAGYLNLIHVADVVRVILAAEQIVEPPDLYLVADGHPVQRIEYYRELARQLKAPDPQFGPPSESLLATDRAASADKRVRNQHMLEKLKIILRYSSYREGLSAIVREELAGDVHRK